MENNEIRKQLEIERAKNLRMLAEIAYKEKQEKPAPLFHKATVLADRATKNLALCNVMVFEITSDVSTIKYNKKVKQYTLVTKSNSLNNFKPYYIKKFNPDYSHTFNKGKVYICDAVTKKVLQVFASVEDFRAQYRIGWKSEKEKAYFASLPKVSDFEPVKISKKEKREKVIKEIKELQIKLVRGKLSPKKYARLIDLIYPILRARAWSYIKKCNLQGRATVIDLANSAAVAMLSNIKNKDAYIKVNIKRKDEKITSFVSFSKYVIGDAFRKTALFYMGKGVTERDRKTISLDEIEAKEIAMNECDTYHLENGMVDSIRQAFCEMSLDDQTLIETYIQCGSVPRLCTKLFKNAIKILWEKIGADKVARLNKKNCDRFLYDAISEETIIVPE